MSSRRPTAIGSATAPNPRCGIRPISCVGSHNLSTLPSIWPTQPLWAPSVIKHPSNGQYYLIYACGGVGTCIARSASPLGPWINATAGTTTATAPLFTAGQMFGSNDWFDAQFFVDGSTVYMTFGGGGACGIATLAFGSDLSATIDNTDTRMTDGTLHKFKQLTGLTNYLEGSVMFKNGDAVLPRLLEQRLPELQRAVCRCDVARWSLHPRDRNGRSARQHQECARSRAQFDSAVRKRFLHRLPSAALPVRRRQAPDRHRPDRHQRQYHFGWCSNPRRDFRRCWLPRNASRAQSARRRKTISHSEARRGVSESATLRAPY